MWLFFVGSRSKPELDDVGVGPAYFFFDGLVTLCRTATDLSASVRPPDGCPLRNCLLESVNSFFDGGLIVSFRLPPLPRIGFTIEIAPYMGAPTAAQRDPLTNTIPPGQRIEWTRSH